MYRSVGREDSKDNSRESMSANSFVFYDPTGKRWIRFRRALGVAGIVCAVLALLFGLSLISNPQLPGLGLPSVEHLANLGDLSAITHGEKANRAVPFRVRTDNGVKYVRNGGNPVIHPRTAAKPRED